MTAPILVVAGIAERDGRILVARRGASDRRWHGLWEFPGGKVEPREHPAEALKREWDEELGADISVGPLLPLPHSGMAGDRHFVVIGFEVEIATEERHWRLHQPSIDETRWLYPHEIWRLELMPSGPTLLSGLQAFREDACPACGVCGPEDHHWLVHAYPPGDEDDPRPRRLRVDEYTGFVCKHCPAYLEYENAPQVLQDNC